MSDARDGDPRRACAAAIGDAAPPALAARAYRRTGTLDAGGARRALRRAGRATTAPRSAASRRAEVAALIASVCRDQARARLGVPRGPARPRGARGVELVEDDGLSPRELDALDGVVTGCTVAIAETGTIVLAAAPRRGPARADARPRPARLRRRERADRRARAGGVATHSPRLGLERRPLTFISGPSATSDIELSRVEGVHGPRASS